MLRKSWIVLAFYLFSLLLYSGAAENKSPNPKSIPIKIEISNQSSHDVTVYIRAQKRIVTSHKLLAGDGVELMAAFGQRVLLEYPTSPYKTLLGELGTLNETERQILLRDDNQHVFIQEKIAGQRVQGKGKRKIKAPVISVPENLKGERKKAPEMKPEKKKRTGRKAQ